MARPCLAEGSIGGPPAPGFSVGPSLAWASVPGTAHFLPGFDVTYREEIYWQTVGIRSTVDRPMFVAPYAEVGLWLLLNGGVGYTMGITSGSVVHFVHLFAGVPVYLGDSHLPGRWIPLVEPYYRPAFRVAGADCSTVHEVGLLLKVFEGP